MRSTKFGEVFDQQGVAATRGAGPGAHTQHPLSDALQTQDVSSNLVGRLQVFTAKNDISLYCSCNVTVR